MSVIVVTGTDTGIGKTVFAAGLTARLRAQYWKPVQAGLAEETDRETVARLSGRPTLPEALRLHLPASPHIAAAAEGKAISLAQLRLPPVRPLVVEGAGGLMVPLTPRETMLDLFAAWRCPVVLVARTTLGTINHSLLSLMALAQRELPVLGVAFVGDAAPEVEQTIVTLGKTRHLGRLPLLQSRTAQELHRAFDAGFAPDAFPQ